MSLRVVKLGGSLLDLAGVGEFVRRWLGQQRPGATLLVVGGGKLADAIRQSQTVHGLSDTVCHYACLDVMAVNAAMACELLPEGRLVRRLADIDRSPTAQLQIVDVREFLAGDDLPFGVEPLPESWAVTSDSIAARLALILEAGELVLLKSTLPAPGDDLKAMAAAGVVDECFPRAVREYWHHWARQSESRTQVRVVNLRDAQSAERLIEPLGKPPA